MDFTRLSLKLFGSNVGRTTIRFLGIAVFARALGASEMGMFFVFQELLGMIAIPPDFGFRGAIEKRISEGSDQSTHLTSAQAVKLVPMALVVGLSSSFRTSTGISARSSRSFWPSRS